MAVLGAGLVVGSNAQAAAYLNGGSRVASSLPQASGVLPLSPLAAVGAQGMDLGIWENITRQALTPSFGESLGFSVEFDFGLLSDYEHLFVPGFMEPLGNLPDANHFSMEFLVGRVSESPLISEFSSQVLAFGENPVNAIDRELFIPGFRRELGEASNLNVAAVFARQSYSSWGLGSTVLSGGEARLPGESSAGAGVRLGFSSELAPGIQFGAAYQSRIEMDAFQNYRGVYSEPGDFDIPASANIGVVVKPSARASLSFDIQRVLYSEVNSFTTSVLPDRFLSLLGDSTSPQFDWDDLTVYRLGWAWQSSEELTWQFQYSTSQQPSPTAEALVQALSPEFADRNMSFGFSKRTGPNARLNFAASYAPSELLLGNSPFGRSTNLDGEQFEFEVLWIWDF